MDDRILGGLARHALAAGASGAVVAVREDGETAWGAAGNGMDASTRFHVGSIGKTFLAALVLGLVDEERLELQAPLALYLPEIVANADAIHLQHLLQHTSGLRDYLQEESFLTPALTQPGHRLEPGAVLELVADDPLFAPGQAWAYASTNYLLLALVVETVAHAPLREVLHARLTEPLGLTDTGLPPLTGPPPVDGHMAADNWLAPGQTDATSLTESIAYGADSLVSTPSNLARFLETLLGGELLSGRECRSHPDHAARRQCPCTGVAAGQVVVVEGRDRLRTRAVEVDRAPGNRVRIRARREGAGRCPSCSRSPTFWRRRRCLSGCRVERQNGRPSVSRETG
jgi:D-alanyl-D-alanine carboxypeptidase